MKIDITLSVLLENAANDLEIAIEEIIKKYQIPEELTDIPVEKLLLRLKTRKISLCSSALYNQFKLNKNNESVETLKGEVE